MFRISVSIGLLVGLIAVLALTSSASAATLAALWHMEDPSTMEDSSGNGNNGTTKKITSVPGSSGNGYHFNGKSSVATVPSSNSLNPGNEDIKVTLDAKISKRPSRTVEDYDLIRKGLGTSSGGDYKMEILRSGKALCLFGDGGSKGANYSVSSGPNLADGRWHEISCVKTASNIQLIVDGTTYLGKVKIFSISNNEPLSVGAKSEGGDWTLGDLDEATVEIGSTTAANVATTQEGANNVVPVKVKKETNVD